MNFGKLSRREIIYLSFLFGFNSLVGCSNKSNKPLISSIEGTLPKKLLTRLTSNWQYQSIEIEDTYKNPFSKQVLKKSSLIILDDGWISTLSTDDLASLKVDSFNLELDYQAVSFLRNLGEVNLSNKVFPISMSPWIMLFRNGEKWLEEASESWDVLLNRELSNKIILPQSPRLVMSIANKISSQDGLLKLKKQTKIFDDRNAINWLLSGEARLAILPLRSCWKSLFRDPRLSVVIPKCGSPLNWTVVINSKYNKVTLPINWIKNGWESKSLPFLLAQGWTPPLPIDQLRSKIKFPRNDLAKACLPSDEIWSKCWSLGPLSMIDKDNLTKLWLESN